MDVHTPDNVLAVQKRPPGAEQEIGQPDGEEGVVAGLRLVEVLEDGTEAPGLVRVEATRVPADRIAVEQGAGVHCGRGPGDEGGAEDRPPQHVVGSLVDEHVLLIGEEPRQRAGGQFVAALAQEVGSRASYHQVDLELDVVVDVEAIATRRVPDHRPVNARWKAQILEHRKKR
jgi:hypothetical protein